MSNSLDSTLVNKILLTRGISKLQGKLPFLGAFTTDFSDDVRDQRSRSISVPFVSGGSAVQTNPTDFETGDTGSINRVITMDHISRSFYITSADYGSGTRLESLADTAMTIVANAIEAKVFALLTQTNYVSAVASVTGDMTSANLKALWAAVPGDYKVAVLKDSKYAAFLPADLQSFNPALGLSVLGFDRLDHSSNGFASAESGVVGFASAKSGIVMAAAIPDYTPEVKDMLTSSEVMEVPGLGISVQLNTWASAKTRQTWASFDVLFGAQVGDTNALKLVTGAN
jgi:hypothetical protein